MGASTYNSGRIAAMQLNRDLKKQGRKTNAGLYRMRLLGFKLGVVVNRLLSDENLPETVQDAKRAFARSKAPLDDWVSQLFEPYTQFGLEYAEVLRAVRGKATAKQFATRTFTVSYAPVRVQREPKPIAALTQAAASHAPFTLSEQGVKTFANLTPASMPSHPARTRHVEFEADDEPRVTPTKQERAYDTQKELEQELARAYATIAAMKKTDAAKDRLIAAQADEITALRAKLKGRAA